MAIPLQDITVLARQGVLDLPLYVPGKPIEDVQREFGLSNVVKLASNENPLGPSPLAIQAMRQAMETVHWYPESAATALREALAERWGVAPDMVLVSNASDNVLTLIAQALLNPGEEAITCVPTFSAYEHVVRVAGGNPVYLPLKGFRFDLDAIRRAISPRTKLVFVCNPNNPTGTIVSRDEFDAFATALPPHVVLVVDEAYGEYVESPEYPDTLAHVKAGRNVVVVRTFSKIYGLAGLRVGYAIAPREIIGLLSRVREPFPVNRLAQAAALAALGDAGHVENSRRVNSAGKEFLYRELAVRGLSYVPTEANFILIDTGCDADVLFRAMLRLGVIVRPASIWGMPTCIRVTIGTAEQNERFMDALDRAMGRTVAHGHGGEPEG